MFVILKVAPIHEDLQVGKALHTGKGGDRAGVSFFSKLIKIGQTKHLRTCHRGIIIIQAAVILFPSPGLAFVVMSRVLVLCLLLHKNPRTILLLLSDSTVLRWFPDTVAGPPELLVGR